MHLIQILLPLYDKEHNLFSAAYFTAIRQELTDKFGGITSYSRAPATGLWKENEAKTVKDDITIYEVVAEVIDRDWWREYKEKLKQKFEQDEVMIRAWETEML